MRSSFVDLQPKFCYDFPASVGVFGNTVWDFGSIQPVSRDRIESVLAFLVGSLKKYSREIFLS